MASSTTPATTATSRKKNSNKNDCKPGVTLQGSSGPDELTGTADSDTIRGQGGNDRLSGLGCRDKLYGQSGNDQLNGGSNNDKLEGGDGQDQLKGGGGKDTLRGGSQSDLLVGGNGDDDLGGGNGPDTLRGDDGDDRIVGGGGNDVIVGGFGDDRLTGGGGKDRFVYNSVSEGQDRIIDFDTDEDKIDLSNIFKSSKYNDSNQFRDYLVVVKDNSDTLIRVDPDGEKGDKLFTTICRLVDTNFDDVKKSNFIL